ncbi:MAG: RNA polymerase sigma factor [Planctomycetota bacterium]|jgi:RNA polymerase sigma-70 factor (ECF subfamily)
MIEDKLLVWKLRLGSSDALRRIYQKYKDNLLRLAVALSNDVNLAEDAVHEVFLNVAQSPQKLRVDGNLKAFLATCVANRIRNINKAGRLRVASNLDDAESVPSNLARPQQWIIENEQTQAINNAIAELPPEQREVVVLHLQGEMTFREIMKLQGVSINTVQSRYRYGLDKLRSLLIEETE